MLRRIAVFLILLTAVFFAFGWIFVDRGMISQTTYLYLAGIVGGVASVVGLIGLVRPPLTRSDLGNLEWESLTKIAENEKELAEVEGRKARVHTELQQLTRTREELEELVKKASVVLFLREEIEKSTEWIIDFLDDNREFAKRLESHRANVRRLKSLKEELDENPDISMINEVLGRVQNHGAFRRKAMMETLDQIPLFGPILKLVLIVLDTYSEALKVVVRFPLR